MGRLQNSDGWIRIISGTQENMGRPITNSELTRIIDRKESGVCS